MSKGEYVTVYKDGQTLGRFTLREAAAKAGIHAAELKKRLRYDGGTYVAGALTFVGDGEE